MIPMPFPAMFTNAITGGPPVMVTERDLPGFRAERLEPAAVLAQLPGPEGLLLFNEPPGVGNSTLARTLIPAAVARGFDLVILVAPTRAILAELPSPDVLGLAPDAVVTLEARPKARCGPLDPEWSSLERSGCAALAKATLCQTCPHGGTCPWPDQLERITPETRLVVMTEQYLVLNPTMIPALIARSEATAALVLLDETLFLT